MPSTSDATYQRSFSDGPYLSTLLNRIRTSHPDFPLDTTILNSLLLSLVAPAPSNPFTTSETTGKGGGLHVILRTKKEDVGLVANLANLVSEIPGCSDIGSSRNFSVLECPAILCLMRCVVLLLSNVAFYIIEALHICIVHHMTLSVKSYKGRILRAGLSTSCILNAFSRVCGEDGRVMI